MRLAWILATLFSSFFLTACSDGDSGERDTSIDTVCTPGHLRCAPDSRPWIQQCNEEGTGWEDHVPCDGLCHEGICYSPLDAGTG